MASPSRLRQFLVPTWPPQSVAEALLLVAVVAATGLLLELWFEPRSDLVAAVAFQSAGVAVAGALMRAMALGLLLGLAGRLALGIDACRALGLGALLLCATWTAPLLAAGGIALPWAGAAVAAVLSLAVTAARRSGPARSAALALSVAVLAGLAPFYDAAHAWLLDVMDVSVRGALIGGFDGAQRGALDGVPLALAVLLAWVAAPAPSGRAASAGVLHTWGAGPLALGALALAWGFVDGGTRQGMLAGLLHPPALYAPLAQGLALALLLPLAMALRMRRRRRAETMALGSVAPLAAGAALLGIVAGVPALPGLAVAALVLMLIAAPPGAARPGLVPNVLLGALLALALWAAGAMTVPGMTPERLADGALAAAGVAGAGASIAGMARLAAETSGRSAGRSPWPRALAALWLAEYAASLCAVAYGAGRSDLVLPTALAAGALVPSAVVLAGPDMARGGRLLVAAAIVTAVLLAVAAAVP